MIKSISFTFRTGKHRFFMKEVESFQITFDDTNYQITIYSIQMNRITAYFAIAHDGYISQKIFYKDKNEMVYYFTDIKELRSRLELFVESLKIEIK